MKSILNLVILILVSIQNLVLGQSQDEALERAATVELVGGITGREGIVILEYDGTKGKLCDRGFDVQDAKVICRMLGFTGEARHITDEQGQFGPGATSLTNYLLEDLTCDGSERTIADCQKGFWKQSVCKQKRNEVGLQCLGERVISTTTTPKPKATTTQPPQICAPGELPSTDVRLIGGSTDAEGKVEVKKPNGTWGAICDDSWGKTDAQVVCRMLCYNPTYSVPQIGAELYGNASSEYYLDDVNCRGNETSILDCEATVDADDCTNTEPASVKCLAAKAPPSTEPQPEVECGDDKIKVIFDRLDEQRLREEYIQLKESIDQRCGYTEETTTDFITMLIPFIGCETSKDRTNRTHITYSNTVRYAVPPASSIITRTTIYYIDVSCILPRNPDPEVGIEPEARDAPAVDGIGKFKVDMYLFSDSTFTTIVQAIPAKVDLGDYVYVGVSLSSTDRNLKLIVPVCWATPEPSPESEPQYYFIERKCQVEDSIEYYPINETLFGFRFQSFKFQGNNQSFVYVHCESYICNRNEKNSECDRTCSVQDLKRDKRSISDKVQQLTTSFNRRKRSTSSLHRTLYETNKGPIQIIDEKDPHHKGNALQFPKDIIKVRDKSSGTSLNCLSTLFFATFMLLAAYLFSKNDR